MGGHRLRGRIAGFVLLALFASGRAALPAEKERETEEKKPPKRDWDWVALPVPFYTAKTSAGLAAGLVIYDNTPRPSGYPRRDDQIKVVAQATVQQQFSLTTEGVMYWRDGFWRVTEETWMTRFPNLFWGVGNDAPDSARDNYIEERLQLRVGLGARLFSQVYVGGTVTTGYYRSAGVTEGGAVSEYLMTHPGSGALNGAGPFIRRDTRDDSIGTHRGSLTSLSLTFFPEALRSAFVYQMWELDQRNFFQLGQRTVLGFQAFGRYAPGAPPLDELPALGGSNRLRGYYEGRYRDRLFLTAQTEARVRVWRRLSVTSFAGVGNVFPDFSSISFDRTKVAGGVGVRYGVTSERDVNFRLDVAVAPGGFAFYLSLGEAF